ncbi:MAG: AraC family transcriptional regulator [Microthrixaceae bacterium]|nr:AraC family transcriptional regulator [Microthrixaceae bacterium]
MEEIRPLVGTHAPCHGLFPTGLDGVSLYRKAKPSPRQPAVMPPLLNIVVQGTKYAYLDATTYRCGAGDYICAPATLPIEVEAPRASAEHPILGVQVMLNTRAASELLVDLNEHGPAPGSGPAGPTLWHTIGQSHELNHTIGLIRDHLDQPLSIDDIAQRAGMSRAVFDRRFRAATSYAPLQFIKALRLNAAATLITQGSDITTAASSVGYASPAQFSRDFKRRCGQPPKRWSRTAGALEATA